MGVNSSGTARYQRKIKVSFSLHYITHHPNHILYWCEKGGVCMEMTSVDSKGLWELTVEVPIEETLEWCYNYRVLDKDSGKVFRTEPLIPHTLRLSLPLNHVEGEAQIYDRWIDPNPWHRFTDAPLAQILGFPDISRLRIPTFSVALGDAIAFYITPPILDGELLMVGASAACGFWNPEQALPLILTRQGYVLQFPEKKPTEYKLIIRHADGSIQWEEGENRKYEPNEEVAFTLRYERLPSFSGLPTPHRKQLMGTAIPIFSLRSQRSYGVGDLSDVSSLLDWMYANHQSILQLLPFYDTTFSRTDQDSYPYSAVTSYGIHPIYLDVRLLPYYHTTPHRQQWEVQAKQLNQLDKLQYSEAMKLKEEVINYCFNLWYEKSYAEDRKFRTFVEDEGDSLLSYTLFCTIRDRLPLTPVEKYPPYAAVKKEWIERGACMGVPAEKEMMRHSFVQYHLFNQLQQVKLKASARNILLKGDLPIGANRNSEDVWVNPQLFCLDKEAGAPPDAFSERGQDWSFPTYDWDAMAAEGYQWWRKRLSNMNRYLDAIRVDHVLGFFRIWSIPAFTGDPSLGYYVPAEGFTHEEVGDLSQLFNQDAGGKYHPLLNPEYLDGWDKLTSKQEIRYHTLKEDYYHNRNEALWGETAIERLSNIMDASNMLICAEDLGVLTRSITEVLQAFEIFSLEVLRMPKQLGQKFIHPDAIPELSVLTTSTHDMDSLRSWWQTLSASDKCQLAQWYGFMDDVSPRGLIRALRGTRALLLILPLQDWCTLTRHGNSVLPKDERINNPDDPHHIWCYRMYNHISDLPTLPL